MYLASAGKTEDAVEFGEEAISIRRRLGEADPDQFEPALGPLHNIAYDLRVCERPAEAVPYVEEAIAIRRKLSLKGPSTYEPDLAEAERRKDSIDVGKEAVAIRRRLAERDPARFEVDLSSSLHNLACDLNMCGRSDEARYFVEEALQIRRRLFLKDPAKAPELGGSLYVWSICLANNDRTEEALSPGLECVKYPSQVGSCRSGTISGDFPPGTFKISPSTTPHVVATPTPSICSKSYWKFNACKRSTIFKLTLPKLHCLTPSSNWLAPLKTAVSRARRRDVYKRRLSFNNVLQLKIPSNTTPDWRTSSISYAWYLGHCPGKEADGIKPAREALGIFRQLAKTDPSPYYKEHVVNTLDTLGFCLNKSNRHQDVLPVLREGLDIHRRLMEEDPDGDYDYTGSAVLQTYSGALHRTGSLPDALEIIREAVVIFRRLVDAHLRTNGYESDLKASILSLHELAGNLGIQDFHDTVV
ncbi:hypothetical protein FA15DRAFT_456806 [Coprinopsis marcescibilis]|uniref:TPR-like protein n=1 Tax=Coprinopsis marcescibilis TaxID=230819 RepID=A0A5C3L7K9_COPMA|nr:hypothetical protein FA15DRAFT_456806 [Coprinopsis marcescibilis]